MEMYVSFETLVKNQCCRHGNGRFVRNSHKKIIVALIEIDVSFETLLKINVAVKEMDVSLETLVKNQRCRRLPGRWGLS